MVSVSNLNICQYLNSFKRFLKIQEQHCLLLSQLHIYEDSRSFSAEQVEALLVLAFFCTFPFRNSDGEMPGINLYEAMNWGAQRHQAAKANMDCIWHTLQPGLMKKGT